MGRSCACRCAYDFVHECCVYNVVQGRYECAHDNDGLHMGNMLHWYTHAMASATVCSADLTQW